MSISGGNSRKLPLVKLSLAVPFIMELDRRGIDAGGILSEHNLSREMFSAADLFVPAVVVYGLCESVAKAAADPFVGVRVGEALDLYAWPPFVSAGAKPGTIGDFILNFAANANSLASSVEIQLHTNGDYTTFRSFRVFEPPFAPAQLDGFFVGLFVNILGDAVGNLWNPGDVVIRVCEPDAIPTGHRGVRIVSQGDNRGGSIRFPSRWLVKPFAPEARKRLTKPPPTSLRAALREAIVPHLDAQDLSANRVAAICGYSARTLARKLAAEGTTITREIAGLKKETAVKELIQTNRPIAEIADLLGFATPSMFTRSFKRWTGQSPREYRNNSRRDRSKPNAH